MDAADYNFLNQAWGVIFKHMGTIELPKTELPFQKIESISFRDSDQHGARSSYLISHFGLKGKGHKSFSYLHTKITRPEMCNHALGQCIDKDQDRQFNYEIENFSEERYSNWEEQEQNYRVVVAQPLSYMCPDVTKGPYPKSYAFVKMKQEQNGKVRYRISIRECSIINDVSM